ncbi:MAG: endonuclease III [Chloroflexi bacterium]|nr:endonuclease III [Chloroflexota bacterium]
MAEEQDLDEIYARLTEAFGVPRWEPDLDSLSELIAAILSQHTTGANSRRAYDRLCERFPTWETVRDAPEDEIFAAIACAGLARQKAPRIKRLLAQITAERAGLDLDFLAALSIDEAMAWLQRLPGVGQTTAACVLLFGLGRPAMPVDTAIRRIAGRLGLVAPQASPQDVQTVLQPATPDALVYPLHVTLIRLGRTMCLPANPRCEVCPFNDLCSYFGG